MRPKRKYAIYKKSNSDNYLCYCQGTKFSRTDNRCDSKSFIAHRLEEPIWEKLKELILNPDILKKYISKQLENNTQEKSGSTINELEKELHKVKGQKERLLNLYLAGDIGRDILKDKEVGFNKQEDKLLDEINRINQFKLFSEGLIKKSLDFTTLYNKLNINLNNISYENKSKVAKLLIDRVETNGQGFAKVFCILPQQVVMQTNQRIRSRPGRR